ncbi:1-acyl-sn-glycerol-3-phosphate acyltransferase [Bacteroidota bacterium]
MVRTLFHWCYYPLKFHVHLGYKLFFRKYKIVGKHNVPKKGPLIFAAAHQNALVDALIICSSTHRSPHFITRGDIFKKKLAADILMGLKMIPIFRFHRDGLENVRKNDEAFNAANIVLKKKYSLGIFPEGQHHLSHNVLRFRNGIAKMAFRAEAEADFKLGVQIVPTGIHYEYYFDGSGRTLVTYGEPFTLEGYREDYEKDEKIAFDRFLDDLSDRIKPLILHIEPTDQYDEIYNKWIEARIYHKDLVEQLRSDQEIVRRIGNGEILPPGTKEKIPVIIRILKFPFKLIAKLANYIPDRIVEYLLKKYIKDPHMICTFRFGISLFLHPLFYTIYLIILALLIF